jgi:hypothetical protein
VKKQFFIGLVLVFVGVNLFTYATTRYTTTRRVLTHARERMDAALKTEGLYEQVYPADKPRSVQLMMAISHAGGMYYWWNEALLFWGASGLLAIVGVLVPFVQPRRTPASAGR